MPVRRERHPVRAQLIGVQVNLVRGNGHVGFQAAGETPSLAISAVSARIYVGRFATGIADGISPSSTDANTGNPCADQDGLNPAFLDKSPLELIPRGPLIVSPNNERENYREALEEPAGVTLSDHPIYGKYFKMLRVGLPAEAVKAKMIHEGVDPSFLDRDPNLMAPAPETAKGGKSAGRIKSQRVKSARIKSVHTALIAVGAGAKGGPKIRKKKLYWKALDESKVGRDSLWAEKDDDIALDEAEFNLLFVET